ncbi:NAD-dependent epimerase/dehydratase family protein [Aquicoccus sp. G2-2]|uniref:NAD(P)-dependent oxidoreductase n=1 Tax=Aquicoccus sp. G2-2 TaxID=3092120 RepID=UPI002ADFF808|nr:NAD(P)-dependent oxidoreductase [Aquicoccus sp. G2-2]MEA1112249.1 NAD(P)-dependent oxidoreductase [Aquicoccus sp. G2-2]
MSRILITGAAGMVGRALVGDLLDHPTREVIATDLHRNGLPSGVYFEQMDVTGDDPERLIGKAKPDTIVHLASIVTPPPAWRAIRPSRSMSPAQRRCWPPP